VDNTRPTGILKKVVVLTSEANQGVEFTFIGRIFTLYYGEGKRVKEYRYCDGFSARSNDLILNDDKPCAEFRSVGEEMNSNGPVDVMHSEDSSAFSA
jgi:hypothetical protein